MAGQDLLSFLLGESDNEKLAASVEKLAYDLRALVGQQKCLNRARLAGQVVNCCGAGASDRAVLEGDRNHTEPYTTDRYLTKQFRTVRYAARYLIALWV